MPARRLPFFLLVVLLAVFTSVAHASTIHKRPTKAQRVSYYVPVKSGPALHAAGSQSFGSSPFAGSFGLPSSPDNWRGGTGNWSNGADWTAGLPGTSNDVLINTGYDTVTLDTNSSINSLTLGGSSGSSQLIGNGNSYTVTIAGALTVNNSGNLFLSADSMTAGANSSNAGTVDLEQQSTLQINGNFNNSGNFYESQSSYNNFLTVTGTMTNTGTISFGQLLPSSITVGGLVNNGTINVIGGLGVNGNAVNAGTIQDPGGGQFGGLGFAVTDNLLNSGTIESYMTDSATISAGGTLTNTGSLIVQGEGAFASAGTLVNEGQIYVNGVNDEGGAGVFAAADFTNSGTISVGADGGGTEQVSAGRTLTNNVGGLMQFFGDVENLSAATLVNNGTINLVGPSNYISVTGGLSNSGTMSLQLNETVQAASLTNSGSIAFENNSYLQDSGDVINSGTISTSGQYSNTLNITGRLTNNAGGTFSLGVSGDIATVGYVTNAGMINLGSGTMLTVTGGSHATATALPGFLNNGVVNIGQGATLLSAASFTQITGQTTVDGTLQVAGRSLINLAGGSLYGNGGTVAGNVTSNASINIGDMPMTVGALNFMGNYTQGANGSLTFDIAGNAPGQYDQLTVSGHAQLNGLMTVDLLNGYIPQLGNTFEVMTYGSESGTFSMVVGLPINNQEHFVLEYNSTNLTLDVQSGQISGPTIKGGNGTYFVSEPFISTAGEGSSSSTLAQNNFPGAATPEPASIVLFASGLAGIGGVLRRKRKV